MDKRLFIFLGFILIFVSFTSYRNEDGWIRLFDGKTLNGWKASENAGTFSVENGAIKVAGPRSHLFYEGPVSRHYFKNFEFRALVMTKAGANSGIYFHTIFQENGFPEKGFEVQVNNSHTDWKRTGGLYNIKDTKEIIVKDNIWFNLYIKVVGPQVLVKVNNKLVTDWKQPAGYIPPGNNKGRFIDAGTFAIQGHDPESIVYFKDIMVKPLP